MSRLRTLADHFFAPSYPPDVSPPSPPNRAQAPAAVAASTSAPSAPAPQAIAVVCGAADALWIGAALGLGLVSRGRHSCAVVCVWTGTPAPAAAVGTIATPAARRLAATLCARGHDAHAAGRLAIVRLPADRDQAAEAAGGAIATAPAVLALGGPRSAVLDRVLAAQDLVLVARDADADPALARLAAVDLAQHASAVGICDLTAAQAPARLLAACGLLLTPSLRQTLAASLEMLP